jgi:hypothetical protein
VFSSAAERELGNYEDAEKYLDRAEDIVSHDKTQPINEVISERQHLIDARAATQPSK